MAVSCFSCHSSLGCAVDCPNAPWNWDLPRVARFGYLKRLARWLLQSERRKPGFPLLVSWPSDLWWMSR